MESEVENNWMNEFEHFISHWERATEEIKSRELNPNECNKISTVFRKDFDSLLVRKPVGMQDIDVTKRLERLDSKLSSMLAMVCTSELKTVKK